MSAPKVNKRPKPQPPKANKPASAERPTAEKAKAPRKPRKPPIERAARTVELLEKQCDRLSKNLSRWRDDRQDVRDLQTAAVEIKARANEIGAAMVTLLDASFTPTVASGGGRAPLAVGDDVILREARYEPEAHGVNDYRVTGIRGTLFEIESNDINGLKHFVPRAWLSRAEGADAESEDEGEGEGEEAGD